jgi:hypothetical protein
VQAGSALLLEFPGDGILRGWPRGEILRGWPRDEVLRGFSAPHRSRILLVSTLHAQPKELARQSIDRLGTEWPDRRSFESGDFFASMLWTN